MERYWLVLAGAGLGGLARYVVATSIMLRYQGRFPWGTLVVNVTGSFLIGLLMTLLTQRFPHPNWRLFLVVGVLGGYTTFSSFEFETFQAMRDGARWLALSNVVGSVVFGYLAVWAGALLGSRNG